jgi:hypothetical protein
MAFDLSKFQAQCKAEFKKAAEKGIYSVTNKDKEDIGYAVIEEMIKLILKGISPIAGKGRFPGYKWVERANQATKIARGLTKGRRKRAREKAAGIKKSRYPYSVMHKYPDKKERPVNLFLSGDFLASLEPRPRRNGIVIGFNNELSEKKEAGHRAGVNDQPPRPIIPQGKEEFAPSIYRRLVDTITKVLRQKIRT